MSSAKVLIYGFGSAFDGRADAASDVDLLVIHAATDAESCRFAMRCKHGLLEKIANADVTVLSEVEAREFHFIETSRASLIGSIRESHYGQDISTILAP